MNRHGERLLHGPIRDRIMGAALIRRLPCPLPRHELFPW
jgi:hypothetical protein